jgi:glutamate-1-semialdehyde 2,1-aminomutase
LFSLETILKEYSGQYAAVILEPMNVVEPEPDFLVGVKYLSHKHVALLIFDETITGFRYSNGGAQELFGVTPDMATLGKGIANGYPISAIVGRRDVMKTMEDIFFSFTFGGEALSLAAAKATLTKLISVPVLQKLNAQGAKIIAGVNKIIKTAHLDDIFTMSGHPTWSFLNFQNSRGCSPLEIKTLWMQEIHDRGILCLGTHNINYAHSDSDVEALLGAYSEVLPYIGEILDKGQLSSVLKCESLIPLFKVR